MEKNVFLTDITTLRQRARQHIEEGAVTQGYKGDRELAIKLLNEALATELVCVLRYKRHYFMAHGLIAQPGAAGGRGRAGGGRGRADGGAARGGRRGGGPNF